MPFFSIIIPIYNVQDYLAKCLDSIVNQTFGDIEIILINDGSTDKSGAIAKEYAKKDKRIVLIEQENQGLSCARNKGIEMGGGDYIIFVDSDDYVELDMCEKLFNILLNKNIDVLKYYNHTFSHQVDLKKTIKKFILKLYPHISLMKETTTPSNLLSLESPLSGREFLIQHPSILHEGCVWLYAIKRNFLLTHNINFIPKIFYEDMPFIAQILLYSKNFFIAPFSLYTYRLSQNSIMRGKMTKDKIIHSLQSYLTIADFFENLKTQEKDKEILNILEKQAPLYTQLFQIRAREIKHKEIPKEILKHFSLYQHYLPSLTFKQKMAIYFPRSFRLLSKIKHLLKYLLK
ncbi:hypothetical protein CQA57_06790 [Helicobacter anseris]|uniref:Glycosyltransferase 2-like domain-containing protein n=1 Tax=Helicobacter anseris TaxID=375926 RepID=A0A3D8J5R4_9HELI|nr:glycosyltransferase [Helicobacter anseris]RDU72495.1 hypothetical protein CQA57_06790 [Helicobacter anseris]